MDLRIAECIWPHPDASRELVPNATATPSRGGAVVEAEEPSYPAALMSIVPQANRIEDPPWDEIDDALRSIESDTGTLGAVLTATPSYVTSISDASRLSGGIAPLRPHSKLSRPAEPLLPRGAGASLEGSILPDDEKNEALMLHQRRGSTTSTMAAHGQKLVIADSPTPRTAAAQPALPPTPIGADLEPAVPEQSRRPAKETLQAPTPILPLLPGEVSALHTELPPVARRSSLEPFASGAGRHGNANMPSGAMTPPSRGTVSPSHVAHAALRRHPVSASHSSVDVLRTPPAGGFFPAGVGGGGSEPPTYAQTMQSAIYPSHIAPALRQPAPERAPASEGSHHRTASPALATTMASQPTYSYSEPPPSLVYVTMGPSAQPACVSPSPSAFSPVHSVSPIAAAAQGSAVPLVSPMEGSLSVVFQQPPPMHSFFANPPNQQLGSAPASQPWTSTLQLNRAPPAAQYVQGPFAAGPAHQFVTSATIPYPAPQYVTEPAPPAAAPSAGVGQVIFWRS